jgi:hypothetical protein
MKWEYDDELNGARNDLVSGNAVLGRFCKTVLNLNLALPLFSVLHISVHISVSVAGFAIPDKISEQLSLNLTLYL